MSRATQKIANLVNAVVGRDGTRLEILKYIQENGSVSIEEIQSAFGIKNASQVSMMMRELRSRSIVETVRDKEDGRSLSYEMGQDVDPIVFHLLEACELDDAAPKKSAAPKRAKPKTAKAKAHQKHRKHPVPAPVASE